jgi:uncharacterized membrane protein YsdA (DUF1294 family)
VAAVFSAVLIGATLKGFAPRALLGLYAGASVLAFLLYWMDKRAALTDAWRTPENTLHLCALVGGWPGAVVAQQVLRHKTRKESFRAVFWMTVLLSCAAVGCSRPPAQPRSAPGSVRARLKRRQAFGRMADLGRKAFTTASWVSM